jgi:hypothetical protein
MVPIVPLLKFSLTEFALYLCVGLLLMVLPLIFCDDFSTHLAKIAATGTPYLMHPEFVHFNLPFAIAALFR